ncbi:hypothetical protein DEO72_LG8g1960 [Vigna unguiculata]|uniref:Uncharacterized protein n=1 Tax=Vigna unguiculata TaxID=3917 RepID=A0A4D6MS76_VIGUN|nr:hypothetical protein DEO72_LG8g1960 [Vigna unguiculata]
MKGEEQSEVVKVVFVIVGVGAVSTNDQIQGYKPTRGSGEHMKASHVLPILSHPSKTVHSPSPFFETGAPLGHCETPLRASRKLPLPALGPGAPPSKRSLT